MLSTTEHRPVALPNRAVPADAAGRTAAAPPAGRIPLPAGAVAWSRTYLDAQGHPCKADYPVPVDTDGRRTAHTRYACKGKIHVEGHREEFPCDTVAWLEPGAKPRYCPHHGAELTAEKPAAGDDLAAQIWKAAEPGVRPVWLLATEASAALVLHAAHVPAWEAVAATPALAAAGYGVTAGYLIRRGIRNGKLTKGEKGGRRRATIARRARTAAYIATTAGVWLGAGTATDINTLAGKVVWTALLPTFLISAAPWWRYLAALRNRPAPPPDPPVDATPQPTPAREPEMTPQEKARADAVDTWAQQTGFADTAMDPGTWREIPCGWQAVIVATKRGALTSLGGDNLKNTIKRVAAAFDVPRSAITWIDEHDDSPNKALLLVQPNNPLKDGQVWPGPTSIRVTDRAITAEVGRLITGEPMLETLFRFGWGAPGGLTLGTTGSGKSERLRLRLIVERWTSHLDPVTGRRRGLFLSFLHDPKRLESYAEFRDAVHGYGITRDDAHIMVDAFLREMVRRFDFLASLKWTDGKGRPRVGGVSWDPLVHGPIISAIFDEHHELAGDKDLVAKEEKLARYIRACGMRAELASHMGTLGDTGSQALRDMVAGGRASLLRTTSGLNASLATGGQLTGDPRALPREPGMSLVADGETATVMGRYCHIPAKEGGELRTLYDWLFNDENEPIGFPAEIPPETTEAFGSEFMQWMEAGRSPAGRDSTRWASTVTAPVGQAATQDAVKALDALLLVLADATGPLDRGQIIATPGWGGRAVRTLSAALRQGQDAKPPVVRKPAGLKAYELTDAGRARVAELRVPAPRSAPAEVDAARIDALAAALEEAGVPLSSLDYLADALRGRNA